MSICEVFGFSILRYVEIKNLETLESFRLRLQIFIVLVAVSMKKIKTFH